MFWHYTFLQKNILRLCRQKFKQKYFTWCFILLIMWFLCSVVTLDESRCCCFTFSYRSSFCCWARRCCSCFFLLNILTSWSNSLVSSTRKITLHCDDRCTYLNLSIIFIAIVPFSLTEMRMLRTLLQDVKRILGSNLIADKKNDSSDIILIQHFKKLFRWI